MGSKIQKYEMDVYSHILQELIDYGELTLLFAKSFTIQIVVHQMPSLALDSLQLYPSRFQVFEQKFILKKHEPIDGNIGH